MDDEILTILGLTNTIILNQKKMELVYTTSVHGKSFQKLVDQLTGYSAPLIFLLKIKFHTIEEDNQIGILGAFTNC